MNVAENYMVLIKRLQSKRHQETGLLIPAGQKIEIDRPSLVKFVKID